MVDHGLSINTELTLTDQQNINASLLEAISEWQLICPDSRLHNQTIFDYAHLFEKYRKAFKSDYATSYNNLRLVDEVENKLNSLPTTPSCLTHHDLHPGNICKDDNQFVILDWEYAGIGNPWCDAAALQSKFGILTADMAGLPAFKHLNRAQLEQGITDAIVLVQSLEELWVRARSIRP